MIIKNLDKLGKNRKKEIDREAINEKGVNAKTSGKKDTVVTENNAVKIELSGEKTTKTNKR